MLAGALNADLATLLGERAKTAEAEALYTRALDFVNQGANAID